MSSESFLLYGPRGCGKTLFANAFLAECFTAKFEVPSASVAHLDAAKVLLNPEYLEKAFQVLHTHEMPGLVVDHVDELFRGLRGHPAHHVSFLHCTDNATCDMFRSRFSSLLSEEGSVQEDGAGKSNYQITNLEVIVAQHYTKFRTGDVRGSVIGDHVHDISFAQLWNEVSGTTDLNVLSDELAKLREEMLKRADSAEHHASVGAIASAEIEAEKGHGEKAPRILGQGW